jgi:hypothetical protein
MMERIVGAWRGRLMGRMVRGENGLWGGEM